MATLQREKSIFSDKAYQLQLLDEIVAEVDMETFAHQIEKSGHQGIRPSEIEIFQMKLGYMCNQTCSHCHVDAGPDRKEIMTKETMLECLRI